MGPKLKSEPSKRQKLSKKPDATVLLRSGVPGGQESEAGMVEQLEGQVVALLEEELLP
jgi:hypothetical protein